MKEKCTLWIELCPLPTSCVEAPMPRGSSTSECESGDKTFIEIIKVMVKRGCYDRRGTFHIQRESRDVSMQRKDHSEETLHKERGPEVATCQHLHLGFLASRL